MTQKMTGGQALVATLERHGIDTIFGIPGGHSLGIYDALAMNTRIRHVLGRHEQGLGFMADGYARASGRVGVLTTTSGPAVANLACALGGATTDTSPVLAIASTVRSDLVAKDRGGLHDCGQAIEIMRPVCRYVRRCTSVEEIPDAISELIYQLTAGRPGGAFCEIPCDLLTREAMIEIPEPRKIQPIPPDAEKINQAVQLLSTAQRPVLWVGTGAVVSKAGLEIQTLAEKIGAWVIPTTLARGILSCDLPYVVPLDGASLTRVNEVLAEADVVLAIGTMFKQEDTANWTTKLGDKLIHIDIDPKEIGRSYKPHIGIIADARAALREILSRLIRVVPASPNWIARGKQAGQERVALRRTQSPREMGMLDQLRSGVSKEDILICDRCNLGYWAYRYLPVYQPRAFAYPMGYGGLGGALPQAFGAKLACPEKNVVCVIGDGGFQFTATELAVAVQENIPVTILLCNNSAYGAIRANQDRNFGGRRFGCQLKNPDFQKLASAYGITSVRVDKPEDLESSLVAGIKSRQLNLIEFTVDIPDP
jgi:thiamine pyrophosphate-dependent acetolactate synthase large subunit-like protein